ncbi:hypothetical protein FW778_17695 [Ginsengibacter hankyongi]|uniref:Uncharacterized protein n=1 Tax=Ginsengibacter hankyongi TaxID=2607284 RepID=A0A5J5IE07_9BACT|nr:hypothetical protein [Ginsengibacter hankyongi]KAA9037261.1 hypothetical protein FW778_17695 [Ginsengibacter hankyongi]
MKRVIIILNALLLVGHLAKSQGCIIVRNVSGLGQYNVTSKSFSMANWQVSINNRYFKAYRDYKGKVDLKTPPRNQNVIESFSMDLAVTRLLPHGWSLDLGFPISANSRTSNAEHGGPNTTRHTTSAFGMGDLQFTALKWLLKPSENRRGNIQLGFGIKFPTGDFKKQGYFYRNDTTRVLSILNPSIELGDGGTGIIAELNTYYFLNSKKNISLYGNFYYLANPTDVNGTQYTMGKPETAANILLGAYDVSVIDVFSIRAGLNYDVKNWSFSAGIRDEGAPVYDLIGKSDGIRRSGYTFSAEPGVIYKFKSVSIYSYVPFLLSHKVKQSALDKIITKETGVYTSSPGGSGDYQIFIGAQFQL